MANSEKKMKNFVGLSRQYYWVPDAQKSTAWSPNPLGPFSHPGSLFSRRAEPRLFDPGASYIIYIPSGLVFAAKSGIARPSRPAFGIRDFDPLHPPFTFYLQICMSGRNPRKTRSAGLRRHGQPAPMAHPRCRPAPGTPGGEPARRGGRPRRLSP